MTFIRYILCSSCLLLLAPVTAQAERDSISGYAQANRLHTDGWAGVRYDISSPFFPLQDALISISLRLKSKDGRMPDNVICSLRRDFRHVPVDLHTVATSEAGGLDLLFADLNSHTHLKFIVAWKLESGKRIYPHSASISTNGENWNKSAKRTFGSSHRKDDGIPVEIVIDGPEECRLI